jgi:hypothetical protein
MASKAKLFFLALTIIILIPAIPLFSQTSMEDLGVAWAEFATDNGNRLPITADLGLNWSDSYIGQLIDIPPHFGFGITLAMNSLKTDKLDALMGKLDLPKLDPWFASKQFFPLYTAELRIGGFRDAPFDVGFKVGYIPALFELFGEFQYETLTAGGDFRWSILRGYGLEPKLSIGGGINYLNGFFLKKAYGGTWDGTEDLISSGSDLRVTWDVISFMLKIYISKDIFWEHLTLFGGVNGGFSIAKTGIAILGKDFIYGSGPIQDQPVAVYDTMKTNLEAEIGNGSTWEVKDQYGQFGVWGTITKYPVSINFYGGISFDFDNDTHLQVSLLMDIMNLEYGISLGWRWQQ